MEILFSLGAAWVAAAAAVTFGLAHAATHTQPFAIERGPRRI
ncbi:hypothetical protein ACFQ0K_14035 [Nocardioides caeni]|nr:hypothetical protein [Nocardioides caeni]